MKVFHLTLLFLLLISCAGLPKRESGTVFRHPARDSVERCLEVASRVFKGDLTIPAKARYGKAIRADIAGAMKTSNIFGGSANTFERLQGKPLSFEEGLGLFVAHLEQKQGWRVLNKLANMNIQVRRLSATGEGAFRFGKTDIKGRPVMFWDNPVLRTQDDLEEFLGRFLYVYSEAQMPRIWMNSLYRWGIKKEILAGLQEDMLMKISLHKSSGVFDPGKLRGGKRLARAADYILNLVGATRLTELRNNALTGEVLKVYQRSGSQEVYEVIKKREGLTLAIRHGLRMSEGLAAITAASVGLYLGFELYDAKMEFFEANKLKFKDAEDYEAARKTLDILRRDTLELLDSMKQEGDLSKEDRKFLEDLEKELEQL